MSNLTGKNRIEEIIADAYDLAIAELTKETKDLFVAESGKYTKLVLTVGWGNYFVLTNGEIANGNCENELSDQARALIEMSDYMVEHLGSEEFEILANEEP